MFGELLARAQATPDGPDAVYNHNELAGYFSKAGRPMPVSFGRWAQGGQPAR